MKRILLSGSILLAVGAFLFFSLGASNGPSGDPNYKIQLDNAFGLVTGADFKVAGVKAGKITDIGLPKGCIKGDPTQCRALVTVSVTQKGFGSFRTDSFCQSRPQSLIGEYFVECEPGQNGKVLKNGATIPVTHTEATIPADLLQNVMRMPYRERFTLIINELGAAVAGRSEDLAAALRRAVPAIDETDNLLNLLANDSQTIQQLTASSDSVITALANNSAGIARFIDEANRTATHTANQDSNLRLTLAKLPGFLEQLRPAMQKLDAATAANTPVLNNLNAASGQLNRLLTDLPGFSSSAIPALKSLGKASVTGKQAVQAANSTIAHLNKFAKPTPELGQNLAIILHDLDDRSRAVEQDPRSPGGQGYTGLEALLQYVFNQALAINTFGPFGHQLAVDAFIDPRCTPYATPATIAANLKIFGASYRKCYSWLGPSQPGVNETDPSNPSACVPDPGGAPPGMPGPATSACKLSAADVAGSQTTRSSNRKSTTLLTSTPAAAAGSGSSPPSSGGSSSSSGSASNGAPSGGSASSPVNLGKTISQILGVIGVGSGNQAQRPSSTSGNSAQQLLNYLLAP
jgi:virulence factor Mce-like protein